MKMILIRHGEPDRIQVDERGWRGQGRHFAPLTEKGIQQAEKLSLHPLLRDCQLIISSPYTRALQTAAILAKNTGLDLQVEMNLHEWMPDKSFQTYHTSEIKLLHEDFLRCRGEYPNGETRKWETITEIIQRTKPVFERYADMNYQKIIAVSHGGVIRRYTGIVDIEHCQAFEIDFTSNFVCSGWV